VAEVEETEGLVLPSVVNMDTTPDQPPGEGDLQQVSRRPVGVGDVHVEDEGPVCELQQVDLGLPGLEPQVAIVEMQHVLEHEGMQGQEEVEGRVEEAPLMEAGQGGAVVEEILPEVGLEDVRTALGRLTVNTEGRQVMFSSLCPPDSTSRSVAALTFLRVLQMEKNGEVRTVQEEQFGDISVTVGNNLG